VRKVKSEITRARLWFALIAVCLSLLPSVTAQQGGTTRYTYDDNGRLRSVTLPNGDRATYTYDAAGNIVSITRDVFVSITEFTPASGAQGT